MTGNQTRRNPADFFEYTCFTPSRNDGGERSRSSLWQRFNGVPAPAIRYYTSRISSPGTANEPSCVQCQPRNSEKLGQHSCPRS